MPSTQDQVALPAAPKLSLAARYRRDGEIGESPLRSRSPKANKPSISPSPQNPLFSQSGSRHQPSLPSPCSVVSSRHQPSLPSPCSVPGIRSSDALPEGDSPMYVRELATKLGIEPEALRACLHTLNLLRMRMRTRRTRRTRRRRTTKQRGC